MKIYIKTISVTFILIFTFQTIQAQEPGEDHPLLSRFEGATMHAYQAIDYDAVALPNGPIPKASYGSGGKNAEAAAEAVLPLEGRITWISYRAPKGKSTLEVLRNYEGALTADGFEVLFSCTQRGECGGGIGRYLRNIVFPKGYWSRKPMDIKPSYVVGGNTRAMLARRNDDSGTTHIFLYFDDDTSPPAIQHVVVEGEPMQTDQVETGVRNAEELQTALDTEGKAIVEGIFFQYDSAEVLPESAEALEQMARLLTENPDIEVLVVGHTDNEGSFNYNTDLSQRRADAVRQALASEYGIAAVRMSAKGASFMAPIASNSTEEGREQNRRVELVLVEM